MKRFLYAALFLICAAIVASFWYQTALQPADPGSDDRVEVEIPKGSSLRAISDVLEERSLIRSAAAFRWYARWHNAQNLKAGNFVLMASMPVPELI